MGMKLFKSVDVLVQLLVILSGVPFCLLASGERFFYPYFILGGCQLLSCFVHWIFSEDYYPVRARNYYLVTLFGVFVLGLGSLIGFLLVFLYLLLFFSPLLGVWYCYICYKEVKLFQQKEWIQLR
jgi:hypothetical protein